MFKATVISFVLAASLANAAIAQDQPLAQVREGQSPAKTTPTIAAGRALIREEKFDEAVEVFRAITIAEPDNPQAWHYLGFSLHADGRIDEALPCHLMAAEFAESRGVASYNVACVYALRGNKDKAFAWLERSRAAGFSDPEQVEGDADLAKLRDDPRYAAFVKSLGQPAGPAGAMRESTGEDGAPPSTNPKRSGANADSKSASAKAMSADDIAKLPPEQQMDFWLGRWEVTRASGDGPVAKNIIERDLDGKMILETYTVPGRLGDSPAESFKGVSMHYYDASRKQWAQFWVDTRGLSVLTYASFCDGAMRGEGERVLPDGKKVVTRFAVTPQADGTVKQLIENSADEGKTWTTYFDGVYRRVGS